MKRAGLMLSFVLAVAIARAGVAAPTQDNDGFYFRDGDRICFVGDSISRNGFYIRYIEHYLRTRFPDRSFVVRNVGTNGQTAQSGLERIDADVLAWNPTVVVLNFGMNDGRSSDGVERYRKGITAYVEALQRGGVSRIVIASNAPLDIGDEPGVYTGYNRNFDAMASIAERFAAERGLKYVDLFHPCHSLWGDNRRRAQPVPVTAQTLARHPSDYVHARAAGQLTMAFFLLKGLGAPSEVSFASIDAKSGAVETRNCRITQVEIGDETGIEFVRDDAAPLCWIEDAGAAAFDLVPFNDELNRMGLRVEHLPAGMYELHIDDVPVARYSAAQLHRGVNLAHLRDSPLYRVGREIERLVLGKRAAVLQTRDTMYFNPPAWLSPPSLDEQKRAEIERLRGQIDRIDAELAAAARPRPNTYRLLRITPANTIEIQPGERVLHIVGSPFDRSDDAQLIERHMLQHSAHRGLTYRRINLSRTLRSVLTDFEGQILAHEPTLVIVQAGNQEFSNQRRMPEYDFEEPAQLLDELLTRLHEHGIRSAVISVTPVDQGGVTRPLVYPNDGLQRTLSLLRDVSARHGVPFADVFTDAIGGWESDPADTERVHWWELVQQQWRFEPEPRSAVVINVAEKTAPTPVNSSVSELVIDGPRVRFTIEPESGAGPVTVAIAGLPRGTYRVSVDEAALPTMTDEQLVAGIDLHNYCRPHADEEDFRAELQRGHEAMAELCRVLTFTPPAWMTTPDFESQRETAVQRERAALARHDTIIRNMVSPLPLHIVVAPLDE